MEEKERYEVMSPSLNGYAYIHDLKTDNVLNTYDSCDLLNQQSKRIKELEQENGYILFEDGYDKDGNEIQRQFYNTYKEEFTKLVLENKKLRKENQQLKQQLHDLPNKIVEEIRDDMSKRIIEKQIKWGDNIQIGFICNAINECLDTILKKYGGEDEN